MPAMSRRVVISGLGTATGLGVGMQPLWEGLCAGRSALRPITRFEAGKGEVGFKSRLAAEMPAGFSAKDYVPKHYRKAVKVMARDIELAVAAAKFAVEDAGLVTRGTLPEGSTDATTYPAERMGCHIGAGLIAAEADELAMAFATARAGDAGTPGAERLDLAAWGSRGMENLTPLWLLKYLPNMLACHVTIIHGCEGPSNTITCAEASGLLSIGESTRVIERGAADLCFSGGAESKLNLMGLLRHEFAGRLAPTGDQTDGSQIVRPFESSGASGGLMGEAGGILILEAMDTAAARGKTAYAEIAGIGAGHSALAGPKGEIDEEGYRFAIENALDDAEIKPEAIDAIVPTGSGCADTDAAELAALHRVFGARLSAVPLVTLSPMIGNCAAGTGGVQVAVGAMAVREQRLPARLHAGKPDARVDAGPAPARGASLKNVLVSTNCVGGQNAAVVLRRV